MNNICAVCGKPFVNDGSVTWIDVCQGHSARVDGYISNNEILTSEAQPDYSLVLERIAFALEDIANRLGYLRSIAK